MKLNLVPDYVRQRKVNKQIIALLVVLFIVINAAMAFWMVNTQAKLRELQARKSELEAQAQQVDSLYNQANQLIDSAAIALGKAEWVKRVQQHNLKYPELYSEVSRYTSPRVRYSGMQLAQGNQLQLSGFTKGIRELGLYLQTMYNCPLFTAVSLTSAALPGYPTGTGQAGIGAPGFGGFGGGAPQGPSAAAGVSAGGGAPATLAGPGASRGGFGGGFAGGGGVGNTGTSPANLMPFQVVAYLREPITPPAPPANVPGLGIGGAGGGLPTLGGFGGGPGAPPGVLGGRGMGI
ncbi:MAG: PilN domain-containing protein [Fimbriimonadales bacterium]